MKTRIPLSVKIGTWLGLNLVLLGAIGVGVLFWNGGVKTWFAASIGDRLETLGSALAGDLQEANKEDFDAVVARFSATYDLDFGVYLNQGDWVAGTRFELPEQIERRLEGPQGEGGGHPRPPPPRRNDEADRERRPPPRGDEERGEARPPPRDRDAGPPARNGFDGPPRRERADGLGGDDRDPSWRDSPDARRFERLGSPEKWWVLVRIPVKIEAVGPPAAGTLIVVSRSAWAFGNLLDPRPVIWAVGISFLISVGWWAPLVIGMTRSIGQLTGATEAIAEGRFETRAGVVRRDEIGQLGESIDQMASRLDSLVNGQRKFLGDVAHELGSPIGRMQVGTSILEDRVPDNLKAAVGDVREEVQAMSALVGELLAFTKAEMRMPSTEMRPVNLLEVVEQAIAREMGDRKVSVEVSPRLEVGADPGLLLRVVGNVIRNASRYAGAEATVKVGASVRGIERVELKIEDNGPGVPEDALVRLGEAFYRPDAARTREAGGFGLGLSIVKSGVAVMGGTVKFGNVRPHGFVVTITLAVAAS